MDNLTLAKFKNVESKVKNISDKQDANPPFTYSINEVWTGKYWLDGKKIYSQSCSGTTGAIVNSGYAIPNIIIPTTGVVLNIVGTILRSEGAYYTNWSAVSFSVDKKSGSVNYWISGTNCVSVPFTLIIEYTK